MMITFAGSHLSAFKIAIFKNNQPHAKLQTLQADAVTLKFSSDGEPGDGDYDTGADDGTVDRGD